MSGEKTHWNHEITVKVTQTFKMVCNKKSQPDSKLTHREIQCISHGGVAVGRFGVCILAFDIPEGELALSAVVKHQVVHDLGMFAEGVWVGISLAALGTDVAVRADTVVEGGVAIYC